MTALGDQFTLIALPWLVLTLTGDPVALGLAVALMGIPRAVLILFGGALVDRYSPKRVLMLTKHVNTVLLGVLDVLVYSGHAHLPAVFALALGLSLASAFSIPAGTSMLPHAVAPQYLQAANGMMMALRQVTVLAGALLAGLLFALAGDGSGGPRHMHGLALAFGFDALSFAVSAWTLAKVEPRPFVPAASQPVLRSAADGLAAVWRDSLLRSCFIYWGLCACIIGGVMQVALPLLASSRLHGAAALGLLLVPLGGITAAWQGVLLNVVIGVLGGYVQVAVFTWIQQRVPRDLLGRTMSLFMFIFMGLAPLAAALAGWIASRVALATLFGGAGVGLAGAALLAWLCTPMRTLRDAPPAPSARTIV
ncbi:MFS transporter [Massilia sp. TW-1]|uniref:MFS transporter n=1 Tax=Telluria antibiotica TaxID=2717319 RepID=A0ABX0PJT7_9BURK|nr:MFS transporter [Telluria antibiotica]NIA57062.1 MFS transporter [Telluria antibiotica]